jgi:membrane protein YqaA with SNARE-associated domain
MLRRVYDHMFLLAQRPNAMWALAIVSFAESSFFPITPLVMLIPMVLASPGRAWVIAGVCTAASVAGGVAGWGIGYAFYEEIGRPVLEFYGNPYKVVTIASGVADLPLPVLIGASIVGRGIQFFMVAALLWKFGAPARIFIEKRLGLITTVVVLVIVGGFIAARYLL